MPSLNQGRFLRQALRSLLDQGYPELEVVVMDGGSTDESPAVIREYAKRLEYWQSQPDGGQAAAVNEGVRRGTGELVAWLNADDFHCPDALRAVGRAFQRHPGRGLYAGNGFRYADATGTRRPFFPERVAFSRRALREGLDYVLQPSTFVLRTAWQSVGGLDTGLHYGLDWDLFLRVARDHPVVTIDAFLSASREHGETKTIRGGLRRVGELMAIARRHAGRRITPGTAYYLAHALQAATASRVPLLPSALQAAMDRLQASMKDRWGGDGVFPAASDPQDVADAPAAEAPARA